VPDPAKIQAILDDPEADLPPLSDEQARKAAAILSSDPPDAEQAHRTA
jgi:hypothetical protein